MGNFDEYSVKIAAYLDNLMTSEEEVGFMNELSNNPELRGLYEDELEIRFLVQSVSKGTDIKEAMPTISSHEEGWYEKGVKSAFRLKNAGDKKLGLISFIRQYFVAAAAILIIITGITIFFISTYYSSKPNNVAVAPAPSKKSVQADTGQKTESHNVNNGIAAVTLFKKFYRQYTSTHIPVEVSYYYGELRSGRYTTVLNAKESDLQTMGADDDKYLPKQYLHLYKGLSYLELNNTTAGLKQFDTVLLANGGRNSLPYYEAQWYSCLAYLKLGDITKTISIATAISQNKSPFNIKAIALLDDLVK